MLLYYITDRHQFPGNERRQQELLLAKIAEAARAGVDYVQLRERDLSPRLLEQLARDALSAIEAGAPNFTTAAGPEPRTRLLINSRLDVVFASGAAGVHLRSHDMAPSEVRAVWAKASRQRSSSAGLPPKSTPREYVRKPLVIAVSCHTVAEVLLAESHGADFVVFAPVFEKVATPQAPGAGLPALAEACRSLGAAGPVEGVTVQPVRERDNLSSGTVRMPLLALGGVTLDNARACLRAGAAGIAAVRLFQENDVAEVVRQLRAIER